MNQAKKNIKKILNEIKKNKRQPLNIGIRIGQRNPKIDYYCDNCQKLISHNQYKKGKGLCKACIQAIN